MSQSGQYVANSSVVVDHLTGNSGGQIGPDGTGNINIVGSGSVSVVGTPVSHTLTISVAGGGLKWNDVATATKLMLPNNGYITSHNGQITFYLPAFPTFGDVMRIVGNNVGGWILDLTGGGGAFPTGSIIYNTTTSNTSVTSVDIADQFEIVCVDAGSNAWIVLTATGSVSVT